MAKNSAVIMILFFSLIFPFFFFLVDPRLIYHSQEPAFLYGTQFFSDFASYPGGLVWYASAFLTQVYQVPVAGAALITLVLMLVWWQTTLFFRITGMRRTGAIIGALPALALFAAFCGYRFPLSYGLGVLVALIFSNLYLFRLQAKPLMRLLRYAVLAIAAYYCIGTGALLFMVLCGLHELVYRKKYLSAAAMIAFGALLPFLAARFFFVISLAGAYLDFVGVKTCLFAAAQYPRTPALVYAAYLAVPVVIMVRAFVPASGVRLGRCPGFLRTPFGGFVQIALAVAVFAGAAFSCFDAKARKNYQIDFYARHGHWDTIVQAVTPATLDDYTILSQAHLFRALFHEGRLLSDLFAWPNGLPGKAFMTITGPMASRFPMQMSDICFEIGALNLAEFWAHEALTVQGKKPWVLRRLALINIVKGRKTSAEKCIAICGQLPFHGRETDRCRRLLEKGVRGDENAVLRKIGSYQPEKEYLCKDYYSELVNLFENNSANRIAFEYIVAHNLLNDFVGPVVDNTGYFATLGYGRLPRHVEEAVVFQSVLSGAPKATASGFPLKNDMFVRFDRFNQVLSRYGENRSGALQELAAEYGATYWFYLASSKNPVVLERGGPD
ncbi:MAG: hypothetical protein JW768_15305 [Chitinispirillaceae bacterium]|nr:hypothetical protein [Chitinispirillaceae bacterium]